MNGGRLYNLRRNMKRRGAGALLVTSLPNIKYLSGFSGSRAMLVITLTGRHLITDGRYLEQAESEAPGWTIEDSGRKLADKAVQIAGARPSPGILFEAGSMSWLLFRKFEKKLPAGSLVPAPGWIESMRAVKTEEEIRSIKTACAAADEAFGKLAGILRPGISEWDIAAEIEYFVKKQKKTSLSFSMVITSGERTSLVHGRPTQRKLKKGDLVLADFGVVAGDYRSDLTRTFCLGKMNPAQKKIYRAVLESQVECIGEARPGMKAGSLFLMSRERLRSRGYELGHGLGHGIGLEVHELPSIVPGNRSLLRENMVFTIEPGAYLRGEGGVRIEDMVLLKKSGAEVLTGFPKNHPEV